MRLYEVTDPDYMNMVRRDCKPFLEQSGDKKVYRGIRKNYSEVFFKVTVRQDRKPLSFNSVEHALLIDAFEKGGFTANRNNSMFCTGSLRHAKSYGTAYEVYPIGYFSFTWSPEVYDLTREFRKLIGDGVVKQVFADDVYYDADKITYGHHIPDAKDFVDGKLKMSDYYAKYGDDKFLPTKLPYTLVGDGLVGWVKENYQDHDWESAISSGNEIMIACEGYWMLENEILQSLELFE